MKTISLLIFSMILACGGGGNNDTSAIESYEYDDAGVFNESIDMTTPAVKSATETAAEIEQKIIKTGYLDFETKDLEKTHANLTALTKQYGGMITSDQAGKDYRSVYKRVTVRVPSQHFNDLVAGVSKGVAFFDRREISQKDVTEEFVDLEARLNAKKELENRYLELLSKAKNVKEMLEIERELSNIREEIEAKQGRLKYLQNQVSMSTLYCYFYTSEVESGVTVSYGSKMANAFKSGWQGVSVFFLGILTLWPLFVFIGIVILGLRFIIKKNKKS